MFLFLFFPPCILYFIPIIATVLFIFTQRQWSERDRDVKTERPLEEIQVSLLLPALMMLLIHSSTVNFTGPLKPRVTWLLGTTSNWGEHCHHVIRDWWKNSADFTESSDQSLGLQLTVILTNSLESFRYFVDFVIKGLVLVQNGNHSSPVSKVLPAYGLFCLTNSPKPPAANCPKAKRHSIQNNGSRGNWPIITYDKPKPTNV